jgi:hypothetical protein
LVFKTANQCISDRRLTMRPMTNLLRAAALGALAFSMPAVQAQDASSSTETYVSTDQNVPAATAPKQAAEIARGDPARWTRVDDSAARLQSKRKQIAAALQESQGACRALPAHERPACMKQARATYQQEMGALRGHGVRQ